MLKISRVSWLGFTPCHDKRGPSSSGEARVFSNETLEGEAPTSRKTGMQGVFAWRAARRSLALQKMGMQV